MITPYNLSNRKFSDRVAKVAMRHVYPKIFNSSDLEFITPSFAEDAREGIDRIILAPMPDGRKATYTIQERFRRPESGAARYADITISTWLGASNTSSEFYTSAAGFLLWGIFDE